MVVIGKWQGLNLDVFALLLVANTIVYSAYVGGGRGFSLLVPGILYLLLILTFIFFPIPGISIVSEDPRWFNTILYIGPLISMLIVSVISVTLISWLRSTEYQITQRQLALLGNYENILAGAASKLRSRKKRRRIEEFTELQFRNQVKTVLEDLCSHKMLFWYDSACMWLVKNHQDRGPLLFPGPSVNFAEVQEFRHGIDASQGFLSTKELIVINSIKYRHGKWQMLVPRFRPDIDAPAAFIPLTRNSKRIGVVALYGREGGPLPQRQDKAFLQSLGSIISNTMEQWEGRFKAYPQREMNEIFKCQTLEQVFKQVVVILQKYLMASACEVIFRPNEREKHMKVVAALGFVKDRRNLEYVVGRGKTGDCAERGITLRVDDVAEPVLKGFDIEYFQALEEAIEKPVLSWMAIPIGNKGHNHGVIKVVNRTFPSEWFTDEDQELGEDLALRLWVIIEKFLYIQQTEDARSEAERQAKQSQLNAEEASAQQQRAEDAARQRQIDLMTMTHQLQGPLNPVIGALSGLQQASLPRNIQEEIEFSKALAECCLTLCWGTSATFAKAAGQEISLSYEEIDAPAEMRRLCKMLQLTNTDNELTFKYREDDGFPKLRMDPAIFTSVLFSLIHNAMKYAESNTTIFLECTFERETGEAALKVKSIGVRIYPNEKDTIFEPFKRGQALKTTGLKYSGTGLGLWVAKQLMLSVGGDLTVELSREHPDLSVFVVHIPGGLDPPQLGH
jgi:signal transduction histidine kinase